MEMGVMTPPRPDFAQPTAVTLLPAERLLDDGIDENPLYLRGHGGDL
jgi:hypothetical protein